MNWSIKAILARCNGDVNAAELYCVQMAVNYAHLRAEYSAYAFHFHQQVEKAMAAHV